MPLTMELKGPNGAWRKIDDIIAREPFVSISHNTAFGREMYLLVIEPDDSVTTLMVSRSFRDLNRSLNQREIITKDFETARVIGDGDSHEQSFKTDQSLEPRHLRFTHRRLRFSERACPICQELQPAPTLGRHVNAHSSAELAAVPGGVAAIVRVMRRSVDQSIREAKEYPKIQEHLKRSRQQLDALWRGAN